MLPIESKWRAAGEAPCAPCVRDSALAAAKPRLTDLHRPRAGGGRGELRARARRIHADDGAWVVEAAEAASRGRMPPSRTEEADAPSSSSSAQNSPLQDSAASGGSAYAHGTRLSGGGRSSSAIQVSSEGHDGQRQGQAVGSGEA